MNDQKTPPHFPNQKKVLFSYDEKKFAKTISRMTKSMLDEIQVFVFAKEDSSGHCENILLSQLSGKEFDALAKQAAYTMYQGHPKDLELLGVC